MDATGLSGDGGEHHFGRGDGEIVPVVLAHSEEIDPEIIGENGLRDHVANHLRLGGSGPIAALGDVAEGVEAQFQGTVHVGSFIVLDPQV